MKYFLFFILFLLFFTGCNSKYINKYYCHEDVLNRVAVEHYNNVIDYLKENKTKEAYILADSINALHWHLRNCGTLTKEYDEIMNIDNRWFIPENIKYNQYENEKIIKIIQDLQEVLYERSDFSVKPNHFE